MLLLIYHLVALLKPVFFIDVDDSKPLHISVSIKQGLQTVDHGLQTGYKTWTRHKMRTRNYRQYKTWNMDWYMKTASKTVKLR